MDADHPSRKDDSRSDLSRSSTKRLVSFENSLFLPGVDKVQKQKIFEELRDLYNFSEIKKRDADAFLADLKTR